MADKITIYKDEKGEFRWRKQSENNRITATSGEGLTNHNDIVEAANHEAEGTDAVIVDETAE